MTRLFPQLSTQQSPKQDLRSSLAALSSPRAYLEFALTHKLSQEQIREVAVLFLSKFGQHVPRTLPLFDITYDDLISLLAQTANRYERGE